MSLNNKIQLIGHLGKDPEVTLTNSGTKVGRVSLATSDKYKDKEGERIEEVEWHNLIFWGSQAKVLEAYCKKGDHLVISGRLKYRKYNDKEGVERNYTEIVVKEFTKLSNKKEEAPF